MLVPLPEEALGFVLRREVPPHAGCVRRKRPSLAAEQLGHPLALELAAHVPERGVDAGERSVEVRAVELVLELRQRVDERVDVEGVAPERMRRDLAMENVDGDVGVVRRDLTPSFDPLVRPHPDEGDLRPSEALDADDPHSEPSTTMFRIASPPRAAAIASLMRSRG